MIIQTQKLTRRRMELLAELQDALRIFRNCSHDERLRFCNIAPATLDVDCSNEGIPWSAVQLHYYSLALRAARARSLGRIPDGTFCGSEVPRTTKSLTELLEENRPDL